MDKRPTPKQPMPDRRDRNGELSDGEINFAEQSKSEPPGRQAGRRVGGRSGAPTSRSSATRQSNCENIEMRAHVVGAEGFFYIKNIGKTELNEVPGA